MAAEKANLLSRRAPQQARSAGLVAAVLEAAGRVLAREGAPRFTVARVAEAAGVSVGSIYQYFPNKASILFRLQSDEWRRTLDLLHDVLADVATPPAERLRRLVHAFVASEVEEATLRGALADAAPLYRDTPETAQAWAAAARTVSTFLESSAPAAARAERILAAEIMTATLGEVGRRISEIAGSEDDVRRHADALADMLEAYLARLISPDRRASPPGAADPPGA